MKMSGGVEWALHCCVVLTASNTPVPAAKLAELHDVSSSYLAKQLQSLARASLIHSVQGKSGGYVLTRAPESITLLDVVRAVVDAGREDLALYTGNDDNIVLDLVMPFRLAGRDGERVERRIVGGLLGQWAVWTRRAVELLEACRAIVDENIPRELLAQAAPLKLSLEHRAVLVVERRRLVPRARALGE